MRPDTNFVHKNNTNKKRPANKIYVKVKQNNVYKNMFQT